MSEATVALSAATLRPSVDVPASYSPRTEWKFGSGLRVAGPADVVHRSVNSWRGRGDTAEAVDGQAKGPSAAFAAGSWTSRAATYLRKDWARGVDGNGSRRVDRRQATRAPMSTASRLRRSMRPRQEH